MTRNKLIASAAAVLLALSAATGVVWWHSRTQSLPALPLTPIVSLPAGLPTPDAVIATPDLAALPQALLSLPLAKKVLTEDMVDYYEHHPDKLGIEGSLRRIAYEHQLTLQDRILQQLLTQPAEVAFWKTDDGKLGQWAIRIHRDALSTLLGWMAKAAVSDLQLSVAGKLEVGHATEPVYQLVYGPDESILIAMHGPQLLVLSDISMLSGPGVGDHPGWPDLLGRLLQDHSPNPLLQSYGVQAATQGSTLAVGARYLSFGYQQLFSTLHALRLDFSKEAWSTHALLAGKNNWDAAPLLGVAPVDAALCLSAPVEWARLAPTSEAAGVKAAWLQQLEPTAAICWYQDVPLYSPLLIARTHQASAFAQHAPELFDWLIGKAAADVKVPTPANTQGVQRWQRAVDAHDGELAAGSTRYFNVSLALAGDTILFSPSAHLVDQAVLVHARKYPALTDKFDAQAKVQGYANPSAIAQLLEKATLATLPGKDSQPLLRQAAVTYLLPHIKALGDFKPTQWRVQAGADQRPDLHWDDLLWQDAP